MALDKLEFKIIKEADGSEIDLSRLSIKATEALITMLDSMKTIIANTPGAEDAKIQIAKGSARVITEAPAHVISRVFEGYERVVSKKETKSEIVAPWRQLQNLFQANGLEYEALISKNTQTLSLGSEIKKSKEFRAKSIKIESKYSLEFIKGRLIEVGGKRPNIHLLSLSPIRCTERDAIAVNKFLYQDIELLVRRQVQEENHSLSFCGFFPVEQQKDFFKMLLDQYNSKSLDDFLEALHYKLKDLLDKEEFGLVRKLIRIFDHLSVDLNIHKTILVITKSFSKHPEIENERNSLYHTLKNKIDRD